MSVPILLSSVSRGRPEHLSGAEGSGAALSPCESAAPYVRGSVLLQELVDVGRRDQLERDIDLVLDLLALGELQRRIQRPGALAGGVLEDGGVEVARLHG